MGNEDTVHLPNNIHGKTYSIFKMRGVKHVVVPEGITEISQSAFEGCETLESIVLPNTRVRVGACAFKDCFNLKNMYITTQEIIEDYFRDKKYVMGETIFTRENGIEMLKELNILLHRVFKKAKKYTQLKSLLKVYGYDTKKNRKNRKRTIYDCTSCGQKGKRLGLYKKFKKFFPNILNHGKETLVISLKCSLSSKYLKSPPAARSLKIACLCGFNRPRRFCVQ